MTQDSASEDEVRFRYLEQHFYVLLFIATFTVVQQAIRKAGNLPGMLAIVVATPAACFAISWLSSRGRWLSKSEDADDQRYSHFFDIGGFVSVYALVVWFWFSLQAVLWAAKGPADCARPWMAAWATIALAGLAIAAFVALWSLALGRIRRLSIDEMRKPTRYSFNIALAIAVVGMGFFVVSALVTQFDFIDGMLRTRPG